MSDIAAVLLSLAALVGGWLALRHLRGRGVPRSAGVAHASVAAAGVATLALAAAMVGLPKAANAALLCVVLALIGGVFVLLFRLQGERPPMFMVALHALAALVGVALLWVALAG
jgi:FtsH-binding integral membrane protein